MAFKTGLEGKPWYYGLGIGLGLGAAIFFVVNWQVLGPMKETLAAGEQQLEDLQAKIQEGRAAKQQLPRFRDEVRQLEMELDKLLRILPARRNTPDLLRRIRSLAEQGDFALRRFTPGQLSDREFFSEWPIAVSVEGSYHNLALFFDRISRFSRIINIENLNIVALPSNKGTHTLAANFSAKTFVYKEATTPAPAQQGAAPGGGAPSALERARAAQAQAGGEGDVP
ncbi:MAG TPA: type 4a pilus biogenesis protein PilO [Thermoanaerobaculia bacterium]|nr:type 4a pilus biogenesis protein PilO [Thermoanaerobaculia bacterium]